MPGSESRWKFSLSVMLPVIGAVLVTVVLAAGFVVWVSGKSDARALDRQRAAAARMVETAKADFARTQAEQVLRYEVADIFVSGKPDPADIDDYFGSDEYDTYGHDVVAVLDPNQHPVYVARAGERTDLKAYELIAEAAGPLADALRTPAMRAATRVYQDGDADRPPQMTEIVQAGGRAAMLSIMPIVSNWEGQEQSRIYLHVALRYLDADLAQRLMDQYIMNGVHFDTVATTLPDETMVPLANSAGRFVAYLKWLPDVPGRALLQDSVPALVGLVAVTSLVIGLLLFGLARSTRALEKARAEALYRATHDPLTGLANRALFSELLERSPLPLTLLALDLDRFKAVNDTFGHEAGDDLLKQVAARLTPLVPAPGLVARLGGDEFMILLSGPFTREQTTALAASIVETLSQPFRLTADIARIGVSVGIARADRDERNDLVARADFALYDAKESGRNTFRVFDELRKAA